MNSIFSCSATVYVAVMMDWIGMIVNSLEQAPYKITLKYKNNKNCNNSLKIIHLRILPYGRKLNFLSFPK